ncbi:MAG: hypothetical protein PHC51_08175 [bacterium]|nr:hypothetical protein [bacterium]
MFLFIILSPIRLPLFLDFAILAARIPFSPNPSQPGVSEPLGARTDYLPLHLPQIPVTDGEDGEPNGFQSSPNLSPVKTGYIFTEGGFMELVLVIYALDAPFVFRRALLGKYNNQRLMRTLLIQVIALLAFHILLHGQSATLTYPAVAALVVSSLSFKCFRCLWITTALALAACLWQTEAISIAKTLPGDPILFVLTITAAASCYIVLPVYILEIIPDSMKRLRQILLSTTISLSWIFFVILMPKLNILPEIFTETRRIMFLETMALLQLTLLSTLGVEALRRYHCLKRTLAEPYSELRAHLNRKNSVDILSELTSFEAIHKRVFETSTEVIGEEAQNTKKLCQELFAEVDELLKEIDTCSTYPLERQLSESERKHILDDLPAELLVDENYWGLMLRVQNLLNNPSLSRNDRVMLLMRRSGIKRHFSSFIASSTEWRLAYYSLLLATLKHQPDVQPGSNPNKIKLDKLLEDARKALLNTIVCFDLVDEDLFTLKEKFNTLAKAYGKSAAADTLTAGVNGENATA